MEVTQRIIPPEIQEDGSVRYRSVMSKGKTEAICYLVSRRVIPVVFVPGVMGSNLADKDEQDNPVWLLDSVLTVIGWMDESAEERKTILDPNETIVYGKGKLPTGSTLSTEEMQRRGWGEVAYMSYGEFLAWLEEALNDTHQWQTGIRSTLLDEVKAREIGVAALTREEAALSYKYRYPVHAVGYNWLQSNEDSAKRLGARVNAFMAFYRSKGFMCDRAILVTHSMGGLVGRYFTESMGGKEVILGVVNGVMPATGAAVAYKRVKAGTEGSAGTVIGRKAAEVTAVFAQAPGPLQLLPTPEYGTHWLKIRDGNRMVSLPRSDPYNEIYTVRGKWWALCDELLINPLDTYKKTVDKDWQRYVQTVQKLVRPFHRAIANRYHPNTYAFYGDDTAHKTWGEVTWRRRHAAPRFGPRAIDDLAEGTVTGDTGVGSISILTRSAGNPLRVAFDLNGADEDGDGTVPRRSGAAPREKAKVCLAYRGIEHEAAYKVLPLQLFTVWSIVKITDAVKQTSMAYRK